MCAEWQQKERKDRAVGRWRRVSFERAGVTAWLKGAWVKRSTNLRRAMAPENFSSTLEWCRACYCALDSPAGALRVPPAVVRSRSATPARLLIPQVTFNHSLYLP